ncbi:MAG: peptidoglycan-binding protein [Chthoniobacterales bacterium]
MKTENLIGLIVGFAFVTLAPVTWAAGHGGGGGGGGFHGGGGFGGGGGFHGGGFGAGGFHAGGFGAFHGAALAAPHFGVGSRGGGVGFGGSHFAGGVPNFAGAGSRFSSFGRPSSRQPVYEGQPNRSVTPNIAHNGSSMPSGARPSQIVPQRGLKGLTNHVAERHDGNWHHDWDRRHIHFDHGRFFVFNDGFWFGLDAGFFPWDYLPYSPNDYYPYAYYTDTDPYDNSGATYDIAPTDSTTVAAVQTQLFKLGYYNGSIDGVFGPTTRDAVAKYQIANHLNVTGSLSPDTIQSLGVIQQTAS